MTEDCRECALWERCPCGKAGHENGTSVGYSIGECKMYDPIEIARRYAPNFDKPVVEVAEVRHGRWVHKYGDGHEEPAILGGECSICGYIHTATHYCPNCGARMMNELNNG